MTALSVSRTLGHMADDRRAIHAYLTAEGHDVWHTASEQAGVSLSGLLEALAADLAAHPPADSGHPRWDEVVTTARKIDAQRRRRARS